MAETSSSGGTHLEQELHSQPGIWRRAAQQAAGGAAEALPRPGQRVAAVGCGTSWFMAQSYAALREAAGQGPTDAYAASESAPLETRGYDTVLALTRSGTTTEILRLLARLRGRIRTVAVLGAPDTPAAGLADAVVALEYADERSVVQTRFATGALSLLRAHLDGGAAGVEAAARDAEQALAQELDPAWAAAEQITFLGSGWGVGLAHEAALKLREAAQSWTESYPAMEYRHGPLAIAAPGRLTWMFGEPPAGLAAQVAATGGAFLHHPGRDPLADLVLAQRVALARARALGLDPDRPRSLTRSVQLDETA